MQFQTRDGLILQAIYENDGVLAKRHIKEMYWKDKSSRAMECRLSKLYHFDYISWPNREHQRSHPVPEPVCWLSWRGALFIAGSYNIKVNPPKRINENQLRLLQRRLQEQGIRWVREPRWSILKHDIAVTDFKLEVEKSVGQIPSLVLGKWLTESEFRCNTDVITFKMKSQDGRNITMKRGVCPDAYFEIVDKNLRMTGKPHRARFLLEMDMVTHCNPSFGRYKVLPGVAYIKSSAYKSRFGNNHGVWLVITTGGKRRLSNLMQQTTEKVGENAQFFFFTSFSNINNCNILNSPIWKHVRENNPISLRQT